MNGCSLKTVAQIFLIKNWLIINVSVTAVPEGTAFYDLLDLSVYYRIVKRNRNKRGEKQLELHSDLSEAR